MGVDYAKKYYAPRYYRTTHGNAHSICHSYRMDFIMIETLDEFHAISGFCKQNTNLLGNWVFVDGMTPVSKSPTDWYFTRTGRKVPYNMIWAQNGEKSFLDDSGGNERCLSLGPSNVFEFNDLRCASNEYAFLCEKRASFKHCK